MKKLKPVGVAALIKNSFASGFIIYSLIALLVLASSCNRKKKYILQTQTIQVDSLTQIVAVHDSMVKPLLYSHVPGLNKLPNSEAKNVFISALLPSILVAKYNITQLKDSIQSLSEKEIWTASDSLLYEGAKARYKARNINDLHDRIGVLPNSLVLAQAAVESAWGQSRFFREANNVFGIWSYTKNEPRIRAGLARRDAHIHMKVYGTMAESIVDYFETLGSAPAYANLRKERIKTQDPFLLLPHLKLYSEKRNAYTNLLKAVIVQNNLVQYDHYKIDPSYLHSE